MLNAVPHMAPRAKCVTQLSLCLRLIVLRFYRRILAAKLAGAKLSSRPVIGISTNFWNGHHGGSGHACDDTV